MERTTIRTVAGLLLALVVGVAGPVQRAVSHESRTHVDVSGPLFPDQGSHEIARLWTQSKRGAEAWWQIASDVSDTYISLLAAEGDAAEVDVRTDRYAATVTDDRRAILRIATCMKERYSCKSTTFRGAEGFSHDDDFEVARFVGTLLDDAGRTCDIDATWRARPGDVRHEDRVSTHPRTRKGATLDIATSCAGSHRVDDRYRAQMWEDDVIEADPWP